MFGMAPAKSATKNGNPRCLAPRKVPAGKPDSFPVGPPVLDSAVAGNFSAHFGHAMGYTFVAMSNGYGPDFFRVIRLSSGEHANPRDVAIMLTAYIEQYITGLLKRKMPGLNSALSERIFRPSEGALGSLARKLDMARALEVLDPTVCKEAVLVARIRNRFAHNLGVDSFDHPEVASLVDALQSGRNMTVYYLDDKKTHPLDEGWTRMDRFVNAAGDICGMLFAAHMPKDEVVSFSMEDMLGKEFLETLDVPAPLPSESRKPPQPGRAISDPED